MTSEVMHSLAECIMNKELFGIGKRTEISMLRMRVMRSQLDTVVKKAFIEYISADDKNRIKALRQLTYYVFSAERAIKAASHCNNIDDWRKAVIKSMKPSIIAYSEKQIDLALALVLYEQSMRDSEYNDIFCRFTEVYQKEGECKWKC